MGIVMGRASGYPPLTGFSDFFETTEDVINLHRTLLFKELVAWFFLESPSLSASPIFLWGEEALGGGQRPKVRLQLLPSPDEAFGPYPQGFRQECRFPENMHPDRRIGNP